MGYDGSENARRALERAIALSTREGAALRIVVAVNTMLPFYGTTAPYYAPDYAEEVTKEGQKVVGGGRQSSEGGDSECLGVGRGWTPS